MPESPIRESDHGPNDVAKADIAKADLAKADIAKAGLANAGLANACSATGNVAQGACLPADEPTRRARAQSLARTGDVEGLAAALAGEAAASVRAALFAGLTETRAAAPLLPYLASADAALRSGAVAALKALGPGAAPVLDQALRDASPDVRLLAVEVLRSWPPAAACTRLQRVMLHDEHVNVCAQAAEVAAERGAPALAPALAALGQRFADHPFIRFCAHVALTRIGDEAAPDHVLPGTPRDIDLQKFIELFYRHTGVRFADSQFYYIAKQLATQAALQGRDSTSYLAWLTTRQPAAELAALVRRFCAPRATFFPPDAPPAPLAAVLARLAAEASVWVLAQDEGQTAYALAIYAQETEQAWSLSADFSAAALAADGRYERAALSRLPPALAARWFSALDGGPLPPEAAAEVAAVTVDLWGEPSANEASSDEASSDEASSDEPPASESLQTPSCAAPVMLRAALRAAVARRALHALPQAGLGLIVCDHVLAHESEAARLRMTAQFYDALRPGGYLCLGAGETLSRASGLFAVVACEGGVIFQKPFGQQP
jgi:chemotaxis protein methyltransferase CheR